MAVKKNPNTRTHKPASGHTLEDLQKQDTKDLVQLALSMQIENPQELKRQDVIFEILKSQVSKGGYILFTGVLEIKSDKSGFLRSMDGDFSNSGNDAYVSETQI